MWYKGYYFTKLYTWIIEGQYVWFWKGEGTNPPIKILFL